MPETRPGADRRRRPRRLRRSAGMRRLTHETALTPNDLVQPLFVRPGEGVREPIPSMPGQNRLSVDELEAEARDLVRVGVPAVMLFGVPDPDAKDGAASAAVDPDGLVPQAVRALTESAPELVVMTDVCVCAYTSHGHCGLLRDGRVVNDPTLEVLARMARVHAEAGADVVAPSAMMDHQVAAIREMLDEAGLSETAILSYAAKYASAFYGPFRDASGSAPQVGDRKSYQMAAPNVREALREIELDLAEGADMALVKPGLAYLDVVRAARDAVTAPLAAYQVSGEYAMIRAAHERGWLDGDALAHETATAVKRAGADLVVTYAARTLAEQLQGEPTPQGPHAGGA